MQIHKPNLFFEVQQPQIPISNVNWVGGYVILILMQIWNVLQFNRIIYRCHGFWSAFGKVIPLKRLNPQYIATIHSILQQSCTQFGFYYVYCGLAPIRLNDISRSLNWHDKLIIYIRYTAYAHSIDYNMSTNWVLEIAISQTKRNLLIIYCFRN